MQGGRDGAYAIEFVGRRLLCDFGYGHMGASPQQVLAERIIALRPLAFPAR